MIDIFHDILQGKTRPGVSVQYAVVTAVAGGRPILRFTGEDENSSKTYTSIKSYVPAVGDRVIILNNIIIGGWS